MRSIVRAILPALLVLSPLAPASVSAGPSARVGPYQLAGATFGFCDPSSPGTDEYVIQVYRQARATASPSAGVVESYDVAHYVSTGSECARDAVEVHPSTDASTWSLDPDGSAASVVGPTAFGTLNVVWLRTDVQPSPFVFDGTSVDELREPPGSQRIVAGLVYPAEANGSLGVLYPDESDPGAVIVLAGMDVLTSGSL